MFGWFVFCMTKTTHGMRISDWSSYVCSSDLVAPLQYADAPFTSGPPALSLPKPALLLLSAAIRTPCVAVRNRDPLHAHRLDRPLVLLRVEARISGHRSEEHTSELQSLMRIPYAVFCLKKKKHRRTTHR